VSYVWRDHEYSGIFERAYYASPSWDQVDARITWKDKDNRYSVIAYVKNIGDTLGYDGGSTAARLGGVYPNAAIAASQGTATPVTAGLPSTATTSNGVMCAAGCQGVLPGGIGIGYSLTPPRTYGIEFQYRF